MNIDELKEIVSMLDKYLYTDNANNPNIDEHTLLMYINNVLKANKLIVFDYFVYIGCGHRYTVHLETNWTVLSHYNYEGDQRKSYIEEVYHLFKAYLEDLENDEVAYLYELNGFNINVYNGFIAHNDISTYFIKMDNVYDFIIVPSKPTVINGNILWLKTKDIKYAKQLFAQDINRTIRRMKRKIKKLKKKCNKLYDEM